MKKLEAYIKIDELIFDATIGVMTFVLYFIIPDNKLITPQFTIGLAVILFLMVFLVPWYLGSIYARINAHKKKTNSWFYKVLSILAIISGFGTSFMVAFILPGKLGSVLSEDVFYSLLVINLMTGTLGVTLGWLFGVEYEKSFNSADKLKEGFYTYFAAFLSSVSLIGILFFIILLIETNHEYLYMAGYALILIIFIYKLIKKRINEILHSRIFRFYIFPFVICFLGMLALDIAHEVFISKDENTSILNVVSVMTYSGILPIWFVLLFTPPFKLINFTIGLLSVTFYVVSAAGII